MRSFRYGLGFLGNLFSLVIFYSQKEFRRISTGLLFLFISIANFFHLWTLIQEFLTIYSVILFMNVVLQCRLMYFVQNVSRAMSTYFMVTIAVDRLIRSELPMRSKRICTKRNTIIVTCLYLIVFCVFWSFYLYPLGSQNPITGSCSFSQSASFLAFLINVHMPIRAVFICFIPVLIMLLANVRMLMNIRRSTRRVNTGTMGPSSETNMPLPTPFPLAVNAAKHRRMTALDRMLFYMMISNVTLFVVTQVPFHLYSCIRTNLNATNPFVSLLVRAILLTWSSLYFGIAFYFYCLASPLFRKKFLKIVKKVVCYHQLPQLNTGQSTTMA